MTNFNGTTFRVGAVDYSVEVIAKLADRHGLGGQVVYGDTHIQMDEGLSPSRMNEVLLHELTHAMFYEAGFDDHEEDTVNRIAKVLHGMLRDNDFGFLREDCECPQCGFQFEETEGAE